MSINFVRYLKRVTLQGHGESVCYIVTDLLNKELIKKNFKFEAPSSQDFYDDQSMDDDTLMVENAEVSFEEIDFKSKNSISKYFKSLEREYNMDLNFVKGEEQSKPEVAEGGVV
jgi:hypothetical protein